MAGLPILLVIKQPDLGHGHRLSVILLVMLAVAGMPGRYLLLLVVGAVLLVLVALNLGLLQQYQIERLTSFISPNGASQAATYNVTQAKEAIAHGGIFGRGLFHGALTNLAYVPEQQTDFIFSAVGEQLGFVGAGAAPGPLRGRGLADPAHRPAGQGHLRAPAVLGRLRPAGLLGVRERGHEHGDHAGGRHPAAVPLLRRLGHDRLLGRHRHRRSACTTGAPGERAGHWHRRRTSATGTTPDEQPATGDPTDTRSDRRDRSTRPRRRARGPAPA